MSTIILQLDFRKNSQRPISMTMVYRFLFLFLWTFLWTFDSSYALLFQCCQKCSKKGKQADYKEIDRFISLPAAYRICAKKKFKGIKIKTILKHEIDFPILPPNEETKFFHSTGLDYDDYLKIQEIWILSHNKQFDLELLKKLKIPLSKRRPLLPLLSNYPNISEKALTEFFSKSEKTIKRFIRLVQITNHPLTVGERAIDWKVVLQNLEEMPETSFSLWLQEFKDHLKNTRPPYSPDQLHELQYRAIGYIDLISRIPKLKMYPPLEVMNQEATYYEFFLLMKSVDQDSTDKNILNSLKFQFNYTRWMFPLRRLIKHKVDHYHHLQLDNLNIHIFTFFYHMAKIKNLQNIFEENEFTKLVELISTVHTDDLRDLIKYLSPTLQQEKEELPFNFEIFFKNLKYQVDLSKAKRSMESGMVDAMNMSDRNLCLEFDHTQKFGPIRNQGRYGTCTFFAMAALAEEQFCEEDNQINHCASVSPVDLNRHNWHLGCGLKKNGENSHNVANTILKEGVCLEQYARYPKHSFFSLGCPLKKLDCFYENACKVDFDQQQATLLEDIDKIKTHFQLYERVSEREKEKEEKEDVLSEAEIQKLKKAINNKNKIDFYKTLLLPEKCEQNRRIPRNLSYYSKYYRSLDIKDSKSKMLHLYTAFSKGRSVALSVCGLHFFPKIIKKLGKIINPCFSHGVVANAMRWNKEKRICEIHLRNSWGKTKMMNGWYPLQSVLKKTQGIFNFVPLEN